MLRVVAAVLALSGLSAAAQDAPMAAAALTPPCPAGAEPLPTPLAAWTARKPLAAATDTIALDRTTLDPGTAVDLTLAATPAVHYAVRPSHPGGSVSYGGMLRFTVARAGTYRVAIGSAAWLDVVDDHGVRESTAHGRGPACSGIHKMVDFDLKAGTYVLEIAGNGDAQLAVMIARLA